MSQGAVGNNTVPLKKVVLYKHGMGYFERRGTVKGATSVEILCGASEIDDMLKSLMVLTADGARLEAITYDSAKTLEDRMKEFGFDVRAAKGLMDIVSQMKGLPVTVTSSGTNTSGRVVGIDYLEHMGDGGKITREPFLILLSDSTFRRLSLTSILSISVDDSSFSTELNQQLELLFQNAKKKDKKALTVILPDTKGEVVVAYSIPSPIWKTSYRLVVADKRILIQGMAIVDNVQDEDWQSVQMVLVSAAPISFIQPLYDPVQPDRTRIAAQGYRSAGPVVAERGQRFGMPAPAQAPAAPGSLKRMAKDMPMAAAPGGAWGSPGAMEPQAYDDSSEMMSLVDALGATFSGGDLPVDTASSGELFEYRVQAPVTVPRNTSALIPIVQGDIEGERISLYNQQKNQKHPYCAVSLRNTTNLTLEGGPITVMEEDAYAGEALLDVLKPGDKRILPYALDRDVHVIVRNDYTELPMFRIRMAAGVVHMDFRARHTTIYRIENLGERQKTVIVEHPVNEAMKLSGEPKPTETTDSFYRFDVVLKPEELHELAVTQEQQLARSVWFTNPDGVDRNSLQYLIDTRSLTGEMLEQIKEILKQYDAIMQVTQKRNSVQTRIQQYTNDQARARENLKALGSHNERYRQLIDEAEDRIIKANAELTDLQNEYNNLRRKFQELALKELEQELK